MLGLAGAPHCTAMCSAPCAAAIGRGGARAGLAFHLARLTSYALGGAVAASTVAALATWSQWAPALRPVWVLLHAAALALGLWLLVKARQPAWMSRVGRLPQPARPGAWQAVAGTARSAAIGGLWVAWPCGLLQSALVVSAMASHAWAGAAAMAGFALASAPGLVLGPWAWRRVFPGGDAAARERWVARAAGAMLVVISAWALGHDIWHQVAVFCGLA